MSERLRLADYHYDLPAERIAQRPSPRRDAARLMTLDRQSGALGHLHVRDLPGLVRPGDLLVLNAARVETARLRGRKESGGRAEALLLEGTERPGVYRALLRARGRLAVGRKFRFERGARAADAEVVALAADGSVHLAFDPALDPYKLGEMPLPPYIRRGSADDRDMERYQTVYAQTPGSVAAPTAGLHLDLPLLDALRRAGVHVHTLTLHIGAGTFRPLDEASLTRGDLHAERYELPDALADAVAEARRSGGRVLAVGTTSARVLEHAHAGDGTVAPGAGETRLFLRPGSAFHVVDGLLTNFHLPASSLLLLVAAFAGRERVLHAYREAIARAYRFYSYGDAMWIS